jgi:hypothetical protein
VQRSVAQRGINTCPTQRANKRRSNKEMLAVISAEVVEVHPHEAHGPKHKRPQLPVHRQRLVGSLSAKRRILARWQ